MSSKKYYKSSINSERTIRKPSTIRTKHKSKTQFLQTDNSHWNTDTPTRNREFNLSRTRSNIDYSNTFRIVFRIIAASDALTIDSGVLIDIFYEEFVIAQRHWLNNNF